MNSNHYQNLTCLESIDCLGTDINFTMNKQSTFKHAYGGFLTIVLAMCLASLTSVFVTPFFERKQPYIKYKSVKTKDPSLFKLKDNNFFLVYKIEFQNNEISDEIILSYFNYSLYYTEKMTNNGTTNSIVKQLQTRKPTLEDTFGDNFLFVNNHLERAIVPIFTDEMMLGGSTINSVYAFISFELRLYNATDKDYLNKTKQFLLNNPAVLKIYYSDLAILLDNYDNATQPFISYFSDDITFEDRKNTQIQFSLNEVSTDKSYFLENNTQSIKLPLHILSTPKSSQRNFNDNILFSVTINASKFTSSYFRYYTKVPEILASVGGILSIVIHAFGFLNIYIGRYMFNLKIMESLFEFDKYYFKDIKEIHDIRQTRVTIINPKNKINDNSTDKSVKNEKFVDKTLDITGRNLHVSEVNNLHTVHKNKKLKIENIANHFFTRTDVVFQLFCCFMPNKFRKNKEKLFFKAQDHVDNYLDFIRLIKKLFEVDILKYFILNKDQLTVFDMIKRPLISFDDISPFSNKLFNFSNTNIKSEHELLNMSLEDKKNLYKSYERINKKKTRSVIDRKLLKSLEDNLDLINK